MSINFHTDEEEYRDPSGGSNFSDIGQAKFVQRYFCGRLQEESEIDGVKYPSGPVYVGPKTKGESPDAIRNRANAAIKETGKKFPEWVAVLSMPVASLTNRTPEQKGELNFPALQSHCRIVALNAKELEQQENAIGFHLMFLPSLVDAYARDKGWYTEPLFDPQACSNISRTEDAKYVIPTLKGFREAIWKALGENDWKAMYESTEAPKLKEALALARNPWDAYVRTVRVSNPAKHAFYAKKDSDPVEYTRQTVMCVTEFFSGEKAAMDAGAKELEDRGGGEQATNGKVTAEQFVALLSKASKKAQVYAADWPAVAAAIHGELPKNATKPQLIKIAKEYEVEVGDVELIRGL